MISFIVIGRNEGWRLVKCFESIYATVKENGLTDYEIIYVDSRSSDGSALKAKEYGIHKVFSITGDCNAAIARNIGAKEARGNILVFIDGDMELLPEGFAQLCSANQGLPYPFVSGNWIDYHYCDVHSQTPGFVAPKKMMKNDSYEIVTGGLFLIERELWERAGGMKTSMRRSQDWEFAIRLTRRGIPLLRKNVMLARHHTILRDKSIRRAWSLLLSGERYYRAVILREHWTCLGQWKQFLRTNYTCLVLWTFMVPASGMGAPWVLAAYPVMVFFRSLKRAKGNIREACGILSIIGTYDVTMPFAILFFHPRSSGLEYKAV